MAVNETIVTSLEGLVANATLPASFEPLINIISRIRGALEILVGGIFGIYLILIVLRWLEYKKVVSLLVKMSKEIHELNENLTRKKKKKKR